MNLTNFWGQKRLCGQEKKYGSNNVCLLNILYLLVNNSNIVNFQKYIKAFVEDIFCTNQSCSRDLIVRVKVPYKAISYQ